MSDFDIDEYNRQFEEKTNGYNKVCDGKPCDYIEKCIESGVCLFCFCDDNRKQFRYIPVKKDSGGIFSFKNICLRDGFPKDGINMKMLKKIHDSFVQKYQDVIIPPIEDLIKELKEIGKFRES